jgi:GT2 family glycosyltransferase
MLGPRVSVVTVGWNHSHLLKQFLRSLEAHLPPRTAAATEVVVVDNASVDDTGAFLATWAAKPGPLDRRVIRSETNDGYAGGNNRALREARGEHALLVNNDVVFRGDVVAACLSHYRGAPRAILGRKLISRAGPWNQLPGRVVRYLEGDCLFASAALWREIGVWRDGAFHGVFDESFAPAFFEDVDLGLRAVLAGVELRQVRLPLRHLGSRTTKATPHFPYMAVMRENHRKFLSKWAHLDTAPAVS